jgi:hypothetical protein
MNDSQIPKDPDLTSTIHLSALRSVPKPRPLEEVFALLTLEEREVVSQLPKNSAMLIVIVGPNRGARYLINSKETLIGRDPHNEIFLDDVTVSRIHAKVVQSGDGDYLVEDLGSLNGTYVNAHQAHKSNLTIGDELQIGKYRMTYFKGRGN